MAPTPTSPLRLKRSLALGLAGVAFVIVFYLNRHARELRLEDYSLSTLPSAILAAVTGVGVAWYYWPRR